MNSLLFVRVDTYSTIQHLFVYLGEITAKGLTPVVDIPHKTFATRRSICAVLQVNHVTHLGGISTTDWQTRPCEREVNLDGAYYLGLAYRGLTFFPLDCADWLLEMEEDGHLNVLYAPKGLFPQITGREPPFKKALNWLKFAYTTDWAGDYMGPVSTVLTQSAVAKADELFTTILSHLRRLYPELYGPAVYLGQDPERREFPLK